MSKKSYDQVFFSKKSLNKIDNYPNFTLVEPYLNHVFKAMCKNFTKTANSKQCDSVNEKPIIIDNQTGQMIYLKKRHQR